MEVPYSMPKMTGRLDIVGPLEILMDYWCHPVPGLGNEGLQARFYASVTRQ